MFRVDNTEHASRVTVQVLKRNHAHQTATSGPDRSMAAHDSPQTAAKPVAPDRPA